VDNPNVTRRTAIAGFLGASALTVFSACGKSSSSKKKKKSTKKKK
jgi:hypothetical protein